MKKNMLNEEKNHKICFSSHHFLLIHLYFFYFEIKRRIFESQKKQGISLPLDVNLRLDRNIRS